MQIIISGETRAADIDFLKKSVSGRVLKEFTQREEVKRYCQAVLRPTILAIAKVNQSLDPNDPLKPR